jgi:hypothetical protein
MNCQQVEKLLPLFVGRDLNERKERAVAEHLETCGECAGAATEYAETRQLLQEFGSPAFSEDVYAGIRQNVLRQIETESSVPSLSQLIAGWFRPRFVWAIATALLIAVSALGVYFIGNGWTTIRQPVADKAPQINPSPGNKQPDVRSGSDKQATAPSTLNKGTREQRQANNRQRQRRLDRDWAPDRANTLAVNSPDAQSVKVESSSQVSNPVEAGVAPRDSEKTLRMEIQTRNPNIRIIWFAQRDQKPSSQNSKGI